MHSGGRDLGADAVGTTPSGTENSHCRSRTIVNDAELSDGAMENRADGIEGQEEDDTTMKGANIEM